MEWISQLREADNERKERRYSVVGKLKSVGPGARLAYPN
jgi:hypothetical protein